MRIWSVTDGDEITEFYPRKAEALAAFRAYKADPDGPTTLCLSVDEIAGPINAALVCRLVSGTGWSNKSTELKEWHRDGRGVELARSIKLQLRRA